MNDIIATFFGDYTLLQLLGFVWFYIIGYIVYGLVETSGRDALSPATPVKWSWKFWFLDNWKRYLTTVLCSYVLFRFYIQISGHPLGNFDAVSFGLIGDGIAVTVKKRIMDLAGSRQKIMQSIGERDDGSNKTDDEVHNGDRHDDGGAAK